MSLIDWECRLSLTALSSSGLAAGATNLIPELIAKGMPSLDTTVNQLSLEHWAIVANVYNSWPFKNDVSELIGHARTPS